MKHDWYWIDIKQMRNVDKQTPNEMNREDIWVSLQESLFPQVQQVGRDGYLRSNGGIPNVVKKIDTRFGKLNYIRPNMKTDNYKRGHKLRIKQAIFGELFTYYHPEMKF